MEWVFRVSDAAKLSTNFVLICLSSCSKYLHTKKSSASEQRKERVKWVNIMSQVFSRRSEIEHELMEVRIHVAEVFAISD